MSCPTPDPRVSILMSDAGGGHRASALSLAEALEDQASVEILNLLDDHTPFPFNRVSESYGPLVNRAPWLYRLVYRSTGERPRVEVAERAAYGLVRRRLRKVLLGSRPDLVVSVHPLLNGIPLRTLRAAKDRAPFVTVVTDPVTVHASWFSPGVDLCVVATEDARDLAIDAGIAPSRVKVLGLPVRRAFSEKCGRPRDRVRAELGLDPERPLAVITGGGAGVGKIEQIAIALEARLVRGGTRGQIAVICGHNDDLRERLASEEWHVPVHVIGYTDHMADWMGAADVMVTKAGPGTIAEAAVMGVPLVVTGFIPGQEEGNVIWVERNRVGSYCKDPRKVAEMIGRWFEPGDRTLEQMSQRVCAIAKPHAARDIARAVLDLCDGAR